MGTHPNFTEPALHRLWQQRLIPAVLLRTTEAQTVEIIDPGE